MKSETSQNTKTSRKKKDQYRGLMSVARGGEAIALFLYSKTTDGLEILDAWTETFVVQHYLSEHRPF